MSSAGGSEGAAARRTRSVGTKLTADEYARLEALAMGASDVAAIRYLLERERSGECAPAAGAGGELVEPV